MRFLHDDFLLTNEVARRLYHEVAARQPIYDYHCHLVPEDLAANRRYDNLTDIWLDRDHYKWRAMRANGVPEHLITGDADPYEKFLAWARTVPTTLRNPLYIWTHLELQRYFGIDVALNEDTAREVWEQSNHRLKTLDTLTILKRFNVALVGTTEDPTYKLELHAAFNRLETSTMAASAWRPDQAMQLADLPTWNEYVSRLGASGTELESLLDALAESHRRFHEAGTRMSDHGLRRLPRVGCSLTQAKEIYRRARSGEPINAPDQDLFVSYMMRYVAELNHQRGWVMQLHLGAIRNVDTRLMNQLGADVGGDSIGDDRQGPGLVGLLGSLSEAGKLPKTILYNANPRDNHLFATMAGNFHEEGVRGKVQFGSGWWFLDQKRGMTDQLNTLSDMGLLANFVGMITDSRSIMSYPRHEYFRRILCNLVGQDVENGELPNDIDLLDTLIEQVCFANARDYFDIALKPPYSAGDPVPQTNQAEPSSGILRSGSKRPIRA